MGIYNFLEEIDERRVGKMGEDKTWELDEGRWQLRRSMVWQQSVAGG